MSNVAAVVVAFCPDAARLRRLVAALEGACSLVLVMDNGGARVALPEPAASPALRLIDLQTNLGIGAALNAGFRLAAESGAEFIISFDQDSTPPAGMIQALVQSFQRLQAGGIKIAAVGPRIVDVRDGRCEEHAFMHSTGGWPSPSRCGDASGTIEADYLMTSGCLMSIAAFRSVGPFDEGFFVDCVDMEWCFRARWAGYSLHGICGVSMAHELGSGVKSTALGITFLGHMPARRYYYARNTVRLIGAAYVYRGWKLRLLLGLTARLVLLPFASAFRPGFGAHWRMLLRGALHGARGIAGPLRQ